MHVQEKLWFFYKLDLKQMGSFCKSTVQARLVQQKNRSIFTHFKRTVFKSFQAFAIFSVGGKEQILGPGQFISIPPNIKHHFWNPNKLDTRYIQEFKPALNIADFFDVFFALSRDNKLNSKGIPNYLRASIIILKYRNEIRVTKLPWIIQYIIFKLLAPIGKLIGYRADYQSKKN